MTYDELVAYMEREVDRDALTVPEYMANMPDDLASMFFLRMLAPKSTSGNMLAAAEHDMVYFSADVEEVAASCTPAQLDVLLALNVFLSEDSFARFV